MGTIDRIISNTGFFGTLGQVPKVSSRIFPDFEIIRNFMLILVISKFAKDPLNMFSDCTFIIASDTLLSSFKSVSLNIIYVKIINRGV